MNDVWVRKSINKKISDDPEPMYFIKNGIGPLIGHSINSKFFNYDIWLLTIDGKEFWEDRKLEVHEVVALRLQGIIKL